MQFPLCWGNPICVKERLDSLYVPKLNVSPIGLMDYPPYEGKAELLAHLKRILGYKYITITTGTTASINIVLRALKRSEGREVVVTNKHHFPYYPQIIEKSGYRHEINIFENSTNASKKLNLVDVPSNPWGTIYSISDIHNNVIWDSVYANDVYINSKVPMSVQHRVSVGSFSKMLGLTGLRVGWIATNNEADHNLFAMENKFENCGVSSIAQDLAVDILDKVDMEFFMKLAQNAINMNREELSSLSKFFDGQNVPVDGMFYPVWVSHKGLSIIQRAGVSVIILKEERENTLIRFNLAQNNKLTKDAMKAIRTADRISK